MDSALRLDRPLATQATHSALRRGAPASLLRSCGAGATTAALALLLGCAEGPAGHVSAAPDGGSWTVMVLKVDDELTARAVDRGVDGIEVLLLRSDGQAVFESTAQAVPGEHVRWSETYHLGLEQRTGEQAVKSSLLLSNEPRESVTLEGAVWTTAFVHAQLSAAARGDQAVGDQSGCDIPGIGDDVSCSNKGACCDAHDACYRDNHCTRGSWSDEHDAPCQTLCNDAVKRCLLRSESTPGKSVCCASGSCGDDGTSSSSHGGGTRGATLDAGSRRDAGHVRDQDAGVRSDAGAGRDAGVSRAAAASRDAGAALDADVAPGAHDVAAAPAVGTGLLPPPGVYPTTNPTVGQTTGGDSAAWSDTQIGDGIVQVGPSSDAQLDPSDGEDLDQAEDYEDEDYGDEDYEDEDGVYEDDTFVDE